MRTPGPDPLQPGFTVQQNNWQILAAQAEADRQAREAAAAKPASKSRSRKAAN